ncbi:Peptidoglycan/xylan/chitin deacetylase, PgdA/CDA1 family [Amycolatopsis tolypomycina]|uniref:Peptidoglycan/xylan/chitin deacetylase, PgdA/CDA1 family n=1 Tax=Amycolatopsis tolypomycina TaxID=208445 RepID=A0A1H4YKG0_9PSEU|nr:polysaccharide deacetylase family protein [Amycolatopsis tolypomycina]SED17581.1 Peptidoglycan/xylan/chitin deacetylase, PgdA/CDA1 family [Amycolatopsis tolypomycina]
MIMKSRRARRWTITAATALVVVIAGAYTLLQIADSRTFQFFGTLVNRVETGEKLVALTFDDGPDPAGTEPVLDTLKTRQVPATFFLIGRDIAAHPDLAKDIAAAGHELGNHSFSHDRMIGVTPSWVADEVEATDALIRATGYTGDIHFRPPNGKKLFALPRYLASHGRTTITWDVEPDSAGTPDAATIAKTTVDQVRPGSIVLLHPMYAAREPTRQAIGPIVDALKQRGFRFVTVSQLLAARR